MYYAERYTLSFPDAEIIIQLLPNTHTHARTCTHTQCVKKMLKWQLCIEDITTIKVLRWIFNNCLSTRCFFPIYFCNIYLKFFNDCFNLFRKVSSNQLCSFTGPQGYKFLKWKEKIKWSFMLSLNRISIDVKHDYLLQYFHELLYCISEDLNVRSQFKGTLQMNKIRNMPGKKSDFDIKGNSCLENESTKTVDLSLDIYRINRRNKSFPKFPVSEFHPWA